MSATSPEDPKEATVSTHRFEHLRSILTQRADHAERRARTQLVHVFLVLILGLAGIVLAPYITSLDRLILRSPAAAGIIKQKVDEIEEMNRLVSSIEGSVLHDVELTPTGGFGIAVGDQGVVLVTNDGGETWIPGRVGERLQIGHVALVEDGQVALAVAFPYTILRSTDAGASWTAVDMTPVGQPELTCVEITPSGEYAVAAGPDGTIVVSEDRGETWSRLHLPENWGDVDFSALALHSDGRFFVALGEDAILATEDRGATWTRLGPEEVIEGQRNSLADVAIADDGDTIIVVGSASGSDGPWMTTVHSSSDRGETWSFSFNSLFGASFLASVAITDDGRGIAVGAADAVLTTRDFGEEWDTQQLVRFDPSVLDSEVLLSGVALDDEANGVAVGTIRRYGPDAVGGFLLHSPDAGVTWSNYMASLNDREALLLQEIRDLEVGGVGRVEPGSVEPRSAVDELMTTAPIRLAIMVLALFLVQILVVASRYNTRISGFYQARADALLLLDDGAESTPIDSVESLTQLVSPDQLDFGRTPHSVVQHAVEIAKEMSPTRRWLPTGKRT